jgi:hypothetical protein
MKNIIKVHTLEEAKAIIVADEQLTAEYEELKSEYENGDLDYGFEYGNFFSLIEDPSKVVIQYFDANDVAVELIVDSIEQAIVAIRDIEAQ